MGQNIDERPGYRRVVLMGRNYPTGPRAIEALRNSLARDGVTVADGDIWAEETLRGAICPYTAKAWIPEVRKVE